MRILLCEDEKELSKVIVSLLKHYNYSVDAVFNGEEALYYLQDNNYDAVIMDVMIPKINGIEVVKKLRAIGNTIPVIMLTAKSTLDDKVLGLDSGANDYLTKPFEIKELLARLRAITRTQISSKSSILSIGDLTLNQANYELKSKSESFILSGKEYQIAEMLMINKSNLISTESFLTKIWGFDSDSDIGVVWVYISSLRKKLKKLNSNVSIKSIRNSGYCLEVINVK